jgi:predicted fused transcriptional regulator/phosphomethylpyrimidine kinase
VTETLFALVLTDAEPADAIIDALRVPASPQSQSERHTARVLESFHEIRSRVRTVGYVRYWEEAN